MPLAYNSIRARNYLCCKPWEVILLPMQRDTIAEWQSLTQLYREMSDQELYELDAGIGDLTEVAQQVLRDEMRSRGLERAVCGRETCFRRAFRE